MQSLSVPPSWLCSHKPTEKRTLRDAPTPHNNKSQVQFTAYACTYINGVSNGMQKSQNKVSYRFIMYLPHIPLQKIGTHPTEMAQEAAEIQPMSPWIIMNTNISLYYRHVQKGTIKEMYVLMIMYSLIGWISGASCAISH